MKTQQEIKDEIIRIQNEQDKLCKDIAGANVKERYDAELVNMRLNSSIMTLIWVLGIELTELEWVNYKE